MKFAAFKACVAVACLALSGVSGAMASPPSSSPSWLIHSEQALDQASVSIVASRPGRRKVLAQLDVLENYSPTLRLSPSGRTVFAMRQMVPNHGEGTGEILAVDISTRQVRTIAVGADADFFVPLSDESVAYVTTVEERPSEGEFDLVDLSVSATRDGHAVELARLENVHGATLAGLSGAGLVLYVVAPDGASFQLLPLDVSAPWTWGTDVYSSREGGIPGGGDPSSEAAAAISPRLVPLGRAPFGPTAREFIVQDDRLIFSAPSRGTDGRPDYRLFSLDVPESVGASRGLQSRGPVELASSGRHSPKAVLDRKTGALVMASHGDDGSELLVSDESDAKKSPAPTADGRARPSLRKIMKSKGTMTPLALDGAGNLVMNRRYRGKDELLWVERAVAGRASVHRIPADDFVEVAGFSEEVEP